MRALALATSGYAGSVVAANWATQTVGLVPIGMGLAVTAGTFAAGATLVLRDAVQTLGSRWVVFAAIGVGALLSYAVAGPALAVASGIAFACSELADWAVFTPLRGRSLPVAVLVSSVASAPVDTVLFLHLAGFGVSWQAVAGQFLVKTAMAGAVAAWLAWRAR